MCVKLFEDTSVPETLILAVLTTTRPRGGAGLPGRESGLCVFPSFLFWGKLNPNRLKEVK